MKKTILIAFIVTLLLGSILSVITKYVELQSTDAINDKRRSPNSGEHSFDNNSVILDKRNPGKLNGIGRLIGSWEVSDDPIRNLNRLHLAKGSSENYRNEIMTSLVEEAEKLDDLPHYTWYPTRFGSIGEIDSHIADLKRIVVLGEAVKNSEASADEKRELIAVKSKLVNDKLEDTRIKCAAIKKLPKPDSVEDENLRKEDIDKCSDFIELLEKKLDSYNKEKGD